MGKNTVQVDVAIIGAGTSGLTARRQVLAVTENYLVFDGGPLGTTCARVGCMPSKVLIQAADDFHRLDTLEQEGISISGKRVDFKKVMSHVRKLRDRFTGGVLSSHEQWQDRFIPHYVRFIDSKTLYYQDHQGRDHYVEANKIIIATGSSPVIPTEWNSVRDDIVTTDEFFEQEDLSGQFAVIGLGVIGLELGQALSRLGVNVTCFTSNRRLGGLTDPKLQNYALSILENELKIRFGRVHLQGRDESGKIQVKAEGKLYSFDKILLAMGRIPQWDKLGIDSFYRGSVSQISINQKTLQWKDFPHIFIAGDVHGLRPILHEAADEGLIAGRNAVSQSVKNYQRRVPLAITFSDPNIVSVGKSYRDLDEEGLDYVIGQLCFEGQGRSIVKLKAKGLIHVYAQPSTGLLLGAEMIAPDGEHLGHLLSWAISLKLSVQDILTLPFYHPVIEEGLRTALRDALKKCHPSCHQLEVREQI